MDNTVQTNAKTKTTGADPLCLPAPYKIKTSDKILHEKFIFYGKNAREWTRKCALLLPEIDRREIWRKKDFGNIYEYAAKLAGMSRNSVDDALRILKRAEDKPELRKVIEEKGINSIRPVLTIATQETAKFWAEKARRMSVHTLEAYVREFKKSDLEAKINDKFRNVTENSQIQNLFSEINDAKSAVKNIAPQKEIKKLIVMELDPKTADQLQKLKGQSDWNELMKKFIALHQEKLEAQKPAPEEAAQKAKSRYIPTAIKKYTTARTSGTCAFPRCTKPYKILHHTTRFALTHSHDPDQLAPLCKAHERLAHLGLIENEEKPPEKWRVREKPDETDEKYKIDKLMAKYQTAPG